MTTQTVHFLCPVNVSTVSHLQDQCLKAIGNGATKINLHLSSSGGDTLAGFTAYNFLKSLPIPLVTHNLSNIESIANVIFLAGSERFSNQHARFLFHPLHWGLGGAPTVDHGRLAEWSKCLDDDLKRFVNIFELETQSGRSRVSCSDLIETATIVTPEDAARFGITHGTKAATLEGSTYNWWVTC